jgi:hypothetical protein
MADDSEVLAGGVGNAGAVLRVGDEVHRPASAHTVGIHALLRFLERDGFEGAPRVLGTRSGVERLRYISGDVPIPPFPSWSQSDEVLASTALLLRRYHDAVANFVPPEDATWSTELADPTPGENSVLCHNDVCPENVVYRDSTAVALLDFEFAAPGRRLWDLAALVRMCVPLDTDDDAVRTGRGGLDPFRRLRVAAHGYGVDITERHELLDVLDRQFDQAGEFVRRRVAAGEAAFIDMWRTMGGQARYDRRREWFRSNRARFDQALGDES